MIARHLGSTTLCILTVVDIGSVSSFIPRHPNSVPEGFLTSSRQTSACGVSNIAREEVVMCTPIDSVEVRRGFTLPLPSIKLRAGAAVVPAVQGEQVQRPNTHIRTIQRLVNDQTEEIAYIQEPHILTNR